MSNTLQTRRPHPLKGRPSPFRDMKRHDVLRPLTRQMVLPLKDRLWKHVDRKDEASCWPWVGATTEDGYAVMKQTGGKKTVRVEGVVRPLVGQRGRGRSFSMTATGQTAVTCFTWCGCGAAAPHMHNFGSFASRGKR